MPWMWRRWIVVCVLVAVARLAQAAVFQTTLDNGLTVLIEENHISPVVSVHVFVRTGSIHEQEFLGSGLSHFFEHILHGGTTTTRSEADTQAMLAAIGNQTNAYTTLDHTAYYIDTTTAHWRTAIELLADWMLHSTIDGQEFAREKGVVQRELEQGLDNPQQVLAQLAMATRFQVHPARYPVIGYKELVQDVSRQALVTYYQRMYAPNNMILVVVGDIESAAVLAHVRQTFGTGQRRTIPALSLPQEPSQVAKRTAEKVMPIAQAHMSLSFRTIPLTHPDLYALDALSDILSNGDSARLVQRLKYAQQLVYDIQTASWTPPYTEGNFTVWATLEADKLLAAEDAIVQELYRLRDELVSPQELARAKKQKSAEHIFARETAQERARMLGLDMLSAYDPTFSDAYVQRIQQVTAEDIRQVARRYFHEDTLVRAVVRPAGTDTAALALDAAAPASAVVKKVLANGMTLLLKRNPALPTVALQAYFKAGVRVETPETNGLSQLTATMLTKGTTSRSAEEIATTFDAMGGTITSSSGHNSLFVTATCLREDLATALAVYADVIMHPSFPETELDQTRRLMRAALDARDDDVHAEANQLFRETFFTVSPYRLAPEGNARTLAHVQRQDVIAFQQRYVVPNNMVLAIFGDINLAATAAAVEQTFAGFTSQPLQFPTVPAEPFSPEERRQVKQTKKQVAAVYMGFPGTTMANVTDRYSLHILDAILSGIQLPGGWLHHELRGRQLVYSVHAFNWFGLEPGYFGIYAVTQPPQVEQVITLIRQQLEKAKAGTITDEELAQAKQMAIVSARLERQTNERLASDAALHELYGLGYDFSEQEQTQLEQVTRADVQRVAQAYLRHPTIVVTTPEPSAR